MSGYPRFFLPAEEPAEIRSSRSVSPVVKDRSPLAPATFFLLPWGSIRPTGWLLEQLRIQANGLSGHLGEIRPDVGPGSGWLGGSGESWNAGRYYLDGLLPLAYLLDDKRLKTLAQTFVDWTLEHGWANGMIGPTKNDDWWLAHRDVESPHAISGAYRRPSRDSGDPPVSLVSAF